MRSTPGLLLTVLCVGCGGAQYATHWDGRRGYDGRGDYGYDLAASNAEAPAIGRERLVPIQHRGA